MFCASRRKSLSSSASCAKSSTKPGRLAAASSSLTRSAAAAASASAPMSDRSLRRSPGRRTFTTTGAPSQSTARWTCAIDPAASGTGSSSANASRPNSRSSTARTLRAESRGASSLHQANALTHCAGRIPSALAMNWPSLTYAGPPRRTRRSVARIAPASTRAGPTRTPVAAFAALSSISGASGANEEIPRQVVAATAPIVSVHSRGRASSLASCARSSRRRSSSARSPTVLTLILPIGPDRSARV